LAIAPQARLFLPRVIKLLINATVSLPHPASQAGKDYDEINVAHKLH